MGNKDIVDRTYKFALRIIKLVSSLPHNKVCGCDWRSIAQGWDTCWSKYMSRTTITLPNSLLDKLMSEIEAKSKTEAVIKTIKDEIRMKKAGKVKNPPAEQVALGLPL